MTKIKATQFNGMSKTELGDVLLANLNKVKDANLKERIQYTGAHVTKATKVDLMSLAKETLKALGDKFVLPALAEEVVVEEAPKTSKGRKKAENLVKAPAKTPETEEDDEDTLEIEESEPVAKKSKKAIKKPEEKKSPVEVLDEHNPHELMVRASMFPDEYTFRNKTYIKAGFKTFEEFTKALEDEASDIIIAWYFPKRNLKQFGYFNNWFGKIKSFEDDLDISEPIYTSAENKVAYAVSLYTEAVFTLFPEDFTEVQGIKIGGAVEFEVYIEKPEVVEEKSKRKSSKANQK